MQEVTQKLFELQDLSYREFHSRLMPTINPETIIGVRTPLLRQYATEFEKTGDVQAFMKELPHQYYEENNLHGFLIERIKNFEECIRQIDLFLPYVDNWATCDMIRPKVFGKHLDALFLHIKRWIQSSEPFTVRFGIEMLMRFYLDDAFCVEHLLMVSKLQSEHYYVKMMVAWYFATALAKQYDATIVYYEQGVLEPFTHNKAIQKAIESNRINRQTKEYLRTLRKK